MSQPAPDTLRRIDLERTGAGRFVATNSRGATIEMGAGGDSVFTPVELLLAAIAGCAAVDLELVVTKRSEPTDLRAVSSAHKVRDEHGNRLVDVEVMFEVGFGSADEAVVAEAWSVIPRTLEQINARLCTVGRTVQVGTPIQLAARPA